MKSEKQQILDFLKENRPTFYPPQKPNNKQISSCKTTYTHGRIVAKYHPKMSVTIEKKVA